MRWIIPPVQNDSVEAIQSQLGVSSLLARLLVLRGADTAQAAARFLNPEISGLHDPFMMAGMEAAVTRLDQAINHNEKMLIYGDYDVDGTTAVVTLLTALRMLGAEAAVHVPHRIEEGYGMRPEVMERAADGGFGLVVSVDTGIREHEAVDRARQLGIDCIITDHHLPEGRLPDACAVLNPQRRDCSYPDKNLSGSGVCLKLVQALLGARMNERLLRSFLKIVAIGTIADVVPLVGENRVIASLGLKALEESQPSFRDVAAGRRGLGALLSAAGLEGKKITATDVAFRIAPRLNAVGRMDHAREVIALFTGQGRDAVAIAQHLETLNRQRQQVEEQILKEALAQMERQPELMERKILVFSGKGWHRGVIGIVASRLAERFHRPVLVVTAENGIAHGSGRSIPKFHLLNAMDQVAPLFNRYGGHAQAAGFSLPVTRIQELADTLERNAQQVLTGQDLEPKIQVDCPVSLADIDWELLADVKRLEPCGFGNPKPVFCAKAKLEMPPRLMKQKHLKLRVCSAGKAMDAVGWNFVGRYKLFEAGQNLALAFTIEENTFFEEPSIHLVLRDIQETLED
jgi:single-stranded-DNA-specific exonuclease